MAFDFDDIAAGAVVFVVAVGGTAIVCLNKLPNRTIDNALGGPGSCEATSDDLKATSSHATVSACFGLLGSTTGPIKVVFNRADGRGSFVLLKDSPNGEPQIGLPSHTPSP